MLAGKRIKRLCNQQVLSGPFKGMKYVSSSIGSAYLPKLLGTYECELHATWQELASKLFVLVIDIGAAEGYYAIGSAMTWHCVQITAFETQENGRLFIKQLADFNNVSAQVSIHGECKTSDLTCAIGEQRCCLIIMDCEGAEIELLNPQLIPSLKYVTILVEVHDFINPLCTEILTDRFQETHHMQTIHCRSRELSDIPVSVRAWWLNRWIIMSSWEGRPPTATWMRLEPIEKI